MLDLAHSDRFADLSVREIYATLLDEGRYIGSISTWYRVLRGAGETRERRRLATHPAHVKPELVATAPCQVWSWDITKLLGPQKCTYFYLYVVLDVFSRYVVAWRLETCESAALAQDLFAAAIAREGVNPTRLTVHADGDPAMTSKTLTQFFADLGITKSRSRPRVSNDNPYSESQFKTLKYAPTFPGILQIFNKRAITASSCSYGTTMNIGIVASRFSRRATFITVALRNAATRDKSFFSMPGKRIPSVSFAADQSRSSSQRPRISINPMKRRRIS